MVVVRRNPLKSDPSRTKTLRKKFEQDIGKRFGLIVRAIIALVEEEDAFGLRLMRNQDVSSVNAPDNLVANCLGSQSTLPESLLNQQGVDDGITTLPTLDRVSFDTFRPLSSTYSEVAIANQRFAFRSSSEQVALFEEWLKTEVGGHLTDPADAYWERYIREGYEKGAGRAFNDVHKAKLATATTDQQRAFMGGTREQFLQDAFGQTESIEKVQLLASRTLTDLKGVSGSVATRMNRVLVDGLTQGLGPMAIARRMVNDKEIGIDKRRAQAIARTEILRAHNTGQLDAMEKMGVEEVGVMAEVSTAGDDRVCPLCQPLEGIVLKIKEARGILPRHTSCRCVFVPAGVGEPKGTTKLVDYGDGRKQVGQKRSKTDIEASIKQSVSRERKKGSLADKLKKSRWVGADKASTIAKVRPRSILAPGRYKVDPRAVIPTVPRVKTPTPTFKGKPFNPLGKTSHDMYRLADGSWTPERQVLHNEIIADYLKDLESVKSPKAYMMGGGPASGKSTVVDAGHIKIPKNTMAVDSDKIKGYLPEYIKGVKDGDIGAAAFAHDESSYLSKKILKKASERRSNVLLDGTGDNSLSNLRKKVEMIKSGGQKVEAHYMTMDTELSVKIEKARAAKTGRKVPETFLRETHAKVSEIVPQAIKEGLFDEIHIWDNNIKGQPIRIASAEGKKLVIHDKERWNKFLAKADEITPKPIPKVPKITPEVKTAKLQADLAKKKAESEALKKQLAETKAKTAAAKKEIAEAKKKAAMERAEIAKLKKEIAEEKAKVKAIDKRMKAQDKARDAEVVAPKPKKIAPVATEKAKVKTIDKRRLKRQKSF